MLLPMPVSLYYGDNDLLALSASAGVTFIFGFLVFKLTRFKQDLRAKEGFAVVTFGWLVFSAFGSLPFIFSGVIPSFTDAFFETMSGFTTTGATILTEIESVPHAILFWRSLTHWIGGMGIIVLSLAILPFLGVGGMQLFKAEVPGPSADKLTPRVTETAKILWGVYVLISAAEVIFLMLGGMSLFDALNHTFATMATGGYSTKNASVAGFNSAYIDYVIVFFMVLAGANFSLHYQFLRGDYGIYWRNKEFRYYIAVILGACLLIGVDTFIHQYHNVADSARYTSFQVVSIMTTTGFGTADYEQWSSSSQFILLVLMFVGGSAGSTGGGIKVVRVYLLIKFMLSEFVRLIHPHAVIPVRANNQVVPRDMLMNVLGFFVVAMLVFTGGVLVMTLIGLDMLTSIGATAATLWNIGPGLGDVGPTDNYAAIPVVGKWVLSMLMLMGRLELFTVIILFSPAYWKK
ncbi:MAG: TrkH family potassium uptake protein [Chloroflexi bacterium]|nr:MAG: TrkH family potassium uptake protein [Chloroflexota bacterium]